MGGIGFFNLSAIGIGADSVGDIRFFGAMFFGESINCDLAIVLFKELRNDVINFSFLLGYIIFDYHSMI